MSNLAAQQLVRLADDRVRSSTSEDEDATLPTVDPAIVGPTPVLALIGPPGAGKSTAMRTFRKDFPGSIHFGVRVFFERQTEQRTPIGLRAKPYADHKIWHPDELIAEGLSSWLTENLPLARSVVLESIPRSKSLATIVDRVLVEHGLRIDSLVFLDVPDSVCAARVLRREVCVDCDTFVAKAIPVPGSACRHCGAQLVRRPDDDEATFRRRLARLRDGEQVLLAHYEYRGVITRIDGTRPPEEVAAALEAAAPHALLAARDAHSPTGAPR